MDIRKFRIFCEVTRQKSFTSAAKSLYMTQPAVSKAIAELEQQIQAPLFERYPKQVVLTPEGAHFLSKIKPLMHLYDDLQKELPYIQDHVTLRIGSSITLAIQSLCPILSKLQKMYPALQIKVEVASAKTIVQKVEEHEIDLAFIEGMSAKTGLNSKQFSSYRIKAVCSSAYDTSQITSMQALAKQPLLLREQGSALRKAIDHCFFEHDIIIEPTWTSVNSTALMQAAVQGFGVSFLPEDMVNKKLNEGLLQEIVLCDLPLVNHNYLVWRQEKHLPQPMQTIIDNC